ncbi:transcriptional attenuator, LytR family [Actinacidiphila rubida]|uniref:Transcriptional attenuator, LytR family n=1 Tax=Actinacidiphila rubida TaxID=310780 RepID=A0A1H8PNV8_9ACTN|nr:LCP family protein [Actinacidiphila rubida]SEO43672.1 transcriptional attenuator, LytR family [Actinacidiphila rubida]
MRAVLRWTAIGAGLVLVVAAGVGWAAYRKFSGNIRTDRAAEQVLSRYAAERPRSLVPGARNILVMGADGTTGGGADSAVLLHLSADRQRAAAIGVPRELRVSVPDCAPRPAGTRREAPVGGGVGAGAGPGAGADETFGAAFRGGGAACTIRAFERLSGIRVDHHLVVDMDGFQRISAAVGGPPADRSAALLRALAAEARGGPRTLAHPKKLYGFLDSATSSITADPGLSSLPALYELAGNLRELPQDGLVVRSVPVGGRGAVREPDAGRLFTAVREDRPVQGAAEILKHPEGPLRCAEKEEQEDQEDQQELGESAGRGGGGSRGDGTAGAGTPRCASEAPQS